MKKVLVILLILAVAGGAFAQLTLTGEVRTGLGAVYESSDGSHMLLKAFSKDAERWLGQFRLNGAYTSEDKNFGVNFRFQLRDADITPRIPLAFGWMNLFSNLIKVQAGLVDDGTYNLDSQIIDGDLGEGLGAFVHIKPIDGLSIGLGAYVGEGHPSNGDSYIGNAVNDSGFDINRSKYTIQAVYTMPNVFKVVGGYRTHAWRINNNAGKISGDPVQEVSARAEGEFLLLLVPGLTANVIAVVDNLGDNYFVETGRSDSGQGLFNIFGVFGYKVMDSLMLGLNVGVYTRTDQDLNGDNTTTPFVGELWGTFSVTDSIIPELHVQYGYGTNGTRNATGIVSKWHRKYYINDSTAASASATNGAGGYDDRLSYFSIRPAVLFKLDKATTFEVGDLIHLSMDKDERLGSTVNKGTLFNNIFYVDFKWTF